MTVEELEEEDDDEGFEEEDKGTLARLLALAKTDLAQAHAQIDDLTLTNHSLYRSLGELKHRLAKMQEERDDIEHHQQLIKSILSTPDSGSSASFEIARRK